MPDIDPDLAAAIASFLEHGVEAESKPKADVPEMSNSLRDKLVEYEKKVN
ncbi:MAG: hypothetical protein QM302_04430 [Acidobacteriota bacterium]|nr:hypothetical protein [Acidobacteriota bacterium]